MQQRQEGYRTHNTNHGNFTEQYLYRNGKIREKKRRGSGVKLLLSLLLTLVSLVCVSGMIISYNIHRDVLLVEFLVSLIVANLLFFIINWYPWKGARVANSQVVLTFVSALVLTVSSALLPEQMLVSFVFLICIWMVVFCVNIIYFMRKMYKRA